MSKSFDKWLCEEKYACSQVGLSLPHSVFETCYVFSKLILVHVIYQCHS